VSIGKLNTRQKNYTKKKERRPVKVKEKRNKDTIKRTEDLPLGDVSIIKVKGEKDTRKKDRRPATR
jgi:hypothetical protein